MENTGRAGRIQVSHTTAAEIEKLGKEHWLTKRDDAVVAKGKGVMETYWLVPVSSASNRPSFTSTQPAVVTTPSKAAGSDPSSEMTLTEKHNRLVEWCVEILLDKLRQIQALRQGLFRAQTATYDALVYKLPEGRTCMDEVVDTMELPPYDPKAASVLASVKHYDVEIDPAVVDQLRQFVRILAQAYRPNSFHNFEHCCHVTMCVDKFLKRIVSPNLDGDIKSIHEYTHGLTSDPLLLMGIVLSAVIHDVDHRGISNTRLAEEEKQMAEVYNNKSIAEQHSLE